jgi:hypothetical protein
LAAPLAGHTTGVISEPGFEWLCRRLYFQVKGGAVSREAAFDLACAVLDSAPQAEEATSLAGLCVDDGADPAQLAEATRLVLAGCYHPGFAEAPELLSMLEKALEVVKQDMRACGLPATAHLCVWAGQNAFVEVWGHHNSAGPGCQPSCGSDPVAALVAVAGDAQDAVMHAIVGAWPTCPAHGRGAHAREVDAMAVWWCEGGGGHIAAPIGQWHPLARLSLLKIAQRLRYVRGQRLL